MKRIGANVPFEEYEAEAAEYEGESAGPDRTFTSPAAEASGRQAVRLTRAGQFVAFTLRRPANAITLRYAIPDSTDGKGMDATLAVTSGGKRLGTLALTSRYGWFYGTNPFTNLPADGKPHHFYDEARLLLGRTLPAGAIVRIEVGGNKGEGGAPWYLIDLADFELVPPPGSPPPDAVDVTALGADPTGRADALPAFRAAVSRARGRPGLTVWIPRGTYRLDGHLEVDRVTIAGAGPWYSTLRGKGVGLYGRYPPTPSTGVVLRDFSIVGEVTNRDDRAPLSGVGGSIGGGSTLSNLFIQHQKTGVWLDGPMDGIRISGLRVTDVTADGMNFMRGVGHVVVENSFIRNTGDDGLAMWSRADPDHDNVFRRNTVVAPILANGIALYGGRDNEVSGNVVADVVTQGGGIHVGNRFGAKPVSGTLSITDNLVLRGGSFDPNWKIGIGALWIYALDTPIIALIEVRGLTVVDSGRQALLLKGKAIGGLRFDGVSVRGAVTHLLDIQAPGSAAFRNVALDSMPAEPVAGCRADFRIVDEGGNTGWIGGRTAAACDH